MRLEPPRRAPADEQRLIVLYSLMNLGPCTETQLLQFLSEMDLTNYFDMMFALNELCDRGQAARQKRKDGLLRRSLRTHCACARTWKGSRSRTA